MKIAIIGAGINGLTLGYFLSQAGHKITIFEKDSFIDDKLKLQIADMLYSVNFGKQKGYLYVIIEQQSTVDKLMAFRLLKYIVAVMENHIKRTGDKQLPVVYPLVFYSGKYPHK